MRCATGRVFSVEKLRCRQVRPLCAFIDLSSSDLSVGSQESVASMKLGSEGQCRHCCQTQVASMLFSNAATALRCILQLHDLSAGSCRLLHAHSGDRLANLLLRGNKHGITSLHDMLATLMACSAQARSAACRATPAVSAQHEIAQGPLVKQPVGLVMNAQGEAQQC